MSDKRYEANIIRATAVEPANNLETTSAPGVWSLDEVVELQKKDKWPTAGNVTTDITDVLSTYLYDGTGSELTISNGINLSGEGGLVWTKRRDHAGNGHMLVDTARGGSSFIKSNTTDAANTSYTLINSFNSNGYTLSTNGWVNGSGDSVCSWTFRKAPKFFDVVTFTGTGSAQTIAHNLGSVPGMIIVKDLDRATNWAVYHRGVDSSAPEDYGLFLNLTLAKDNSTGYWNDTAPTSTHFTVGDGGEVGGNSGDNLVAYLFAHNNSDGEFGPDGDQDVIKCGSYSGVGSGAVNVNLGFEPQWIMVKNTTRAEGWFIQDSMRGMAHADWEYLLTNEASAAAGSATNRVVPTATGFTINNNGSSAFGQSGDTCIYMAIRRGPLAEPTSATDVFDVEANSSTGITTGFPVDWRLSKGRNGTAGYTASRLTGQTIYNATNATAAEYTSGANFYFDSNTGVVDDLNGGSDPYVRYAWKRAPSFFDVVAYTGTGSNRTVSHNLGVAPEMIWVKSRNWIEDWNVYHSALGNEAYLKLNTTDQVVTSTNNRWNSTSPTASVFSLGTTDGVNKNSYNYIAYLFATVAGVSKVGSYTGSSSAVNVDCGFTSGARFILIKRSSASGDSWFTFDSARGIVAGNDPFVYLNDTQSEFTSYDAIDPYNAGFTVTTALAGLNTNGSTYIFYAIA